MGTAASRSEDQIVSINRMENNHMTESLSHLLAATAVTLFLMAVIGSQAKAATASNYRDALRQPQPTITYNCGSSYRRCA